MCEYLHYMYLWGCKLKVAAYILLYIAHMNFVTTWAESNTCLTCLLILSSTAVSKLCLLILSLSLKWRSSSSAEIDAAAAPREVAVTILLCTELVGGGWGWEGWVDEGYPGYGWSTGSSVCACVKMTISEADYTPQYFSQVLTLSRVWRLCSTSWWGLVAPIRAWSRHGCVPTWVWSLLWIWLAYRNQNELVKVARHPIHVKTITHSLSTFRQ